MIGARLLWLLVTLVSVGIYLLSLYPNYQREIRLISGREFSQALKSYDISPHVFVSFLLTRQILFVATFCIVGVLLFLYRSSDRSALFVSLLLITFGTVSYIGVSERLGDYPFWIQRLGQFIDCIGTIAMGLFFYLFPDGFFYPSWTRVPASLWVLLTVLSTFFSQSLSTIPYWDTWLRPAVLTGFILSWLLAQTLRYKNRSDSGQRQQTKWVVFGGSLAILGWLSTTVLFKPILPNILMIELKPTMQLAFFACLPISIAFALFRYRLWDVDPIANRTIVYVALTGLIIGIYVLIVSYLSLVFRTEANFAISIVATAVVAIIFQPLRDKLQHGVNRLMYGERDEPTAVIARLGQRLEASLEPDSVLPTVVETVSKALKIPYVAVALKEETDFRIAAEYGHVPDAKDNLVRLPLTYQSEAVGQLIVAPRGGAEKFSQTDRELLSMLAQQAGAATHTIRLTQELRRLNLDLQKSREQLVTAREEERRRLRRDLHDGIGPVLASLLQRLDTVRLLIPRDPQTAAGMAEELKGQVKMTIADIRRLVYALRPPVLDELGLVSAIREYTNEHQGADGLQVAVITPDSLPHLPAAVEVAAYRIILEAFANVVHHAHATTCRITMGVERENDVALFTVEIQDNGQGMAGKQHIGVGIVSMRERTAELGGSLTIESHADQGTRIRACLPMSEE